eukprot:COSAG05_NODE_11346_length_518_cov_0.613365_1_plen_33_part_10
MAQPPPSSLARKVACDTRVLACHRLEGDDVTPH